MIINKLHEFDFRRISLVQLKKELLDTVMEYELNIPTNNKSEYAILHAIEIKKESGIITLVDSAGSLAKEWTIHNKYLIALMIKDIKGYVESITNVDESLLKKEEELFGKDNSDVMHIIEEETSEMPLDSEQETETDIIDSDINEYSEDNSLLEENLTFEEKLIDEDD
jgi:hypothetical protein